MKNINVWSVDKTTKISLPENYTYTVEEEEEGAELTMANGNIVYENPRLRRVLKITAGYIPNADYVKLLNVRKANPFVYLEYPDVNGVIVKGVFRMTIGERELFMFRSDGTPVFTGCEIEFRAKEVI